jgi:predicted RNA-binding Zn-ribbon protein involved in translation (DUF1610 family)
VSALGVWRHSVKKRKVRWDCPECGKRHKTRWYWMECMSGPITMHCEKCGHKWEAEMRPDEKWVKRWRAYA